ncbi:MAG: signal recognition particle-docking protein FtsY [Verrucomicrobia bacterium]|nr:MAG: signal recognition particle-docking protein FtsY [Verrucomicrobiota bacterium]PYK46174.1 MAG: signal recognition particle-docking protein FtsY [Verrucomicrobiota bacterium]
MNFLQSLAKQFAGKPIDWDELEESLIRADLGVPITLRIIKTLQEREAWALLGVGDVIKAVRDEIARILPRDPAPIRRATGKPSVILIVGVNGTGKTTSAAKLAHLIQGGNCRASVSAPNAFGVHRNALQTVMLAAADTFRAAAIEQLEIWAKRLDVKIVRGQHGADPAALCYEAYQAAAKQKIDFLLCDTAGRQHTKANLMAELQKIKRTLSKLDPDTPHETLLVVDATTGSNALSQAREFHNALGLTGLVVTKLDGSGKGGVVVAIQDELGIPTRLVGTGETIDDFAPFDRKKYLENLL